MKTFKKCISVMLTALLCVGCLVFPVSAAEAYPESEHPYADDLDEKYTYTYEGEADGFYITFSEDTYFEEYSILFYDINGNLLDLTLDEALEMDMDELAKLVYFYEYKNGDMLQIYAGDLYLNYFDGNSLAGKTLYIPGDTVTLELVSDESVSGYGFSIDRISDTAPEDIVTVTYDLDSMPDFISCYQEGDEAFVMSDNTFLDGDKICKAWSLTKGGAAEYYGGEELALTESITLYPVYTQLLLKTDEVYSFNNEFEPFAINKYGDEENPDSATDYYMSQDDYISLLRSLYTSGALAAAGRMMFYRYTYWGGSCYGISVTAALQHAGKLDLLAYQQGASSVKELSPSPELISCINYYQAHEYATSMIQHSADFPGTYQYSYELQKMYEEVKNGHIVLFGFYENHSFDSSGHAILLTGAYDDAAGNHILIAYDSNYGNRYANGIATKYIISPDYSEIYSEMYGDMVGFNWLSDFSCFDAFDIHGNTDNSSWFRGILNRLRSFFEMIKNFFASLFGK